MSKVKDFLGQSQEQQRQIVKKVAAGRLSVDMKAKPPSFEEIEAVACGIASLGSNDLAKSLIDELAKISLRRKAYFDTSIKNLSEARFYAKYDVWSIVGQCSQVSPSKQFCEVFDITEKDTLGFRKFHGELKHRAFGKALVERAAEVAKDANGGVLESMLRASVSSKAERIRR